MGKAKDLTNQKYGLLTPIRPIKGTSTKKRKWLCKCDCGNYTEVTTDKLISGWTKGCGCINRANMNICDDIVQGENVLYAYTNLVKRAKEGNEECKSKAQCIINSVKLIPNEEQQFILLRYFENIPMTSIVLILNITYEKYRELRKKSVREFNRCYKKLI